MKHVDKLFSTWSEYKNFYRLIQSSYDIYYYYNIWKENDYDPESIVTDEWIKYKLDGYDEKLLGVLDIYKKYTKYMFSDVYDDKSLIKSSLRVYGMEDLINEHIISYKYEDVDIITCAYNTATNNYIHLYTNYVITRDSISIKQLHEGDKFVRYGFPWYKEIITD